jgi:hypothetical protein
MSHKAMLEKASRKETHLFLSYSSHDRDLALQLKQALEALGVNVWIDMDRMLPGSFVVTDLEQAIEDASAFVVLITAAALSSGWVREECGRAIHLSVQSTFRLPIIPIAVEGTEVPGFLSNRRILQLPARSDLNTVASIIATELSVSPALEKHQRRTMIRWHSRCEGFADGDISILAIIETVTAVAAVIAVSSYLGSLTYIAGLALVAPFALLQTDQSRSLGIRILRRLQWWTRLKTHDKSDSRIASAIRIVTIVISSSVYLLQPLFLLLQAISFERRYQELSVFLSWLLVIFVAPFYLLILALTLPLLVRTTATLLGAIWYPIITLRAVPTNWKNLVLCKDVLDEPEVVPGYLDAVSTGEISADLRILNFLRGLARRPLPRVFCDLGAGTFLHFTVVVYAIPMALLLYVPYYSARWALKSTAAVWAPLLWLASTSNDSTLTLRLRLRIIAEDATSRTVYAFSWMALIFMVGLQLGLIPSSEESVSVLDRIAVFLQQPLPALCIVSAALIAIGRHLFASRVLILDSHKNLSLETTNTIISVATFIQRLIVILLLMMLIAKLLRFW